MKIIEELESLENGPNPPLLIANTGLKTQQADMLFDFDASLEELNKFKSKYPNHRLLIANKGEYDWSEFALFGEREESNKEKEARLLGDAVKLKKKEIKSQKQIEKLKKDAEKLGVEIK
mgnify:CR=1 FL=1